MRPELLLFLAGLFLIIIWNALRKKEGAGVGSGLAKTAGYLKKIPGLFSKSVVMILFSTVALSLALYGGISTCGETPAVPSQGPLQYTVCFGPVGPEGVVVFDRLPEIMTERDCYCGIGKAPGAIRFRWQLDGCERQTGPKGAHNWLSGDITIGNCRGNECGVSWSYTNESDDGGGASGAADIVQGNDGVWRGVAMNLNKEATLARLVIEPR